MRERSVFLTTRRCAMSLVELLELVRDARDNIECGRVNDAAYLLELIEDVLVEVVGLELQ
jgi:hypothetical protein